MHNMGEGIMITMVQLTFPAINTTFALQQGEGRPVIIVNAFADWQAQHKWTFDSFKHDHGDHLVTANDRAPARHADAEGDAAGRQRTVHVPLADYMAYMQVIV
jgi:hypothetical protein